MKKLIILFILTCGFTYQSVWACNSGTTKDGYEYEVCYGDDGETCVNVPGLNFSFCGSDVEAQGAYHHCAHTGEC